VDYLQRIQCIFTASIATKKLASETLATNILAAGTMMATCLQQGGKILSCGNGGSAADAEHFVTELVNRFLLERRELAAIALTANMPLISAIANDYNFAAVFAKQVKALGNKNDLLLAISTSGNSENVIQAINAAKSNGMHIIALTGYGGGKIRLLLDDAKDVELCVVGNSVPRIQEVHILIIHCLCELIEEMLFVKS
jgi:D-sedoheptulose 7-phosphate isomerase